MSYMLFGAWVQFSSDVFSCLIHPCNFDLFDMLNSLQRDQSKEIGQGVQCRQCVHLSRFISSFRSMSLHLILARCL